MGNHCLPRLQGLYRREFEHDACGIGFIVDIEGRKSHRFIADALQILQNLTHRGAVGADPESGDGAGILIQIPHEFMRVKTRECGINLPAEGQYGTGLVFLPRGNAAVHCMDVISGMVAIEGCRVLGWREVPCNPGAVSGRARETCPDVRQVFVANPGLDTMAFERKLFLIRRQAEKKIAADNFAGTEDFYINSLSARTLIYKGMLMAHQVGAFYPDLMDENMVSAIAVVHQRYSTNTFPSWPLAQPFRMLCHNGEINTLRGNLNHIRAREQELASEIWGTDIKKILPVILDENGSDSACLDNMVELLALSGRSLAHSMAMIIPEAWGDKYYMGHDRRGFYEYHANLMEPWDGPAAIAFTDGVQVGGILDRNGLRPARYTITRSGQMILASETGVLDIPQNEVAERGRLQPGKMLVVDTARRRILYNDEVKAEICRRQPYRRWVAANRITFQGFGGVCELKSDTDDLFTKQLAFGFTREDIDRIIRPMAETGAEPIGSMGNDTPLAVLSDQPQLLFNYFKQKFAQVTNPPIDPIRERLVMSLTTFLGKEGNILEERPEHARRLKLLSPIITCADLNRIRASCNKEFRSGTLAITFKKSGDGKGLHKALRDLCEKAEKLIQQGVTVLILSDRTLSGERVPIPSLLAVSAVGFYLKGRGLRSRCGLVLESGEPREVNHFALLLNYGVDAVCPYIAVDVISGLHKEGGLTGELSLQDAVENYVRSIDTGILKIMSKLGISTLRSYRSAQVYEAVGLADEFIEHYFPRTVSRIGGIGEDEVEREALMRHAEAYGRHRGRVGILPCGGNYAYRRDGEKHLWSPEAIHWLQQAARNNDRVAYDKFARNINRQERRWTTLRSLFDFRAEGRSPVELGEVESAGELVRRFMTGAMSFGSLSREAHETMAIAMNRLGGMSNSGEGGEDPARYLADTNGDLRSSAVKQVASGRFGVTIEYLASAREIQIKIAQGAKPGEGGHLPGYKVNSEIGRVRHSTPGVSLISPPPHHDIYSIEDLAQLVFDLKNANPSARISVKLVSASGVGTIAAGVSKGKADVVLISGGDGGTGASPLSSIKHVGMPWELGLAETHQTLVLNGLRDRIRVQTDGQLRTGRDVAVAALLGAEEFGFGTAALVTLGCVLMRKCHLNTCPVGVATQDPALRARFQGAPEYLMNYMFFVAEELREIMASLGIRSFNELVGRADLLKVREGVDHWKAGKLDFRAVFTMAETAPGKTAYCSREQEHGLGDPLADKILADAMPVIDNGGTCDNKYAIRNVNRSIGATLSYHVARKHGLAGLPDNSITARFHGSAGQSFGAFLASGITFILDGDANDYLGKGLSGGRIIVRVSRGTSYDPAENVIVGNTLLYGAIAGEVYINGLAGERFAVRNSGVSAVVEGVGDHGCEYMTGGVVAVLGRTGVNFAAGMSGGVAYVYDPHQDFDLRCNLDMVDLDPVIEEEDQKELRGMLERHVRHTGSARAREMLENWSETRALFVKVMPIEYRRALGQMAEVEKNARKTREEQILQA